jgi:hypothetical protein
MKVLLVADPPAAERWEEHLLKQGFEVTALRADRVHTVHPGVEYVLAMNLNKSGPHIISAAKKAGAKVVHVPPSWTSAIGVMRPIIEKLNSERSVLAAPAPIPLMQRPFANIEKQLAEKRPEIKSQFRKEEEPSVPEPVEQKKVESPTVDAAKSNLFAARVHTIEEVLRLDPKATYRAIQKVLINKHGGSIANTEVKKVRDEFFKKNPLPADAKPARVLKTASSSIADRHDAASDFIIQALKAGQEPTFHEVVTMLRKKFNGDGMSPEFFDRLLARTKKHMPTPAPPALSPTNVTLAAQSVPTEAEYLADTQALKALTDEVMRKHSIPLITSELVRDELGKDKLKLVMKVKRETRVIHDLEV